MLQDKTFHANRQQYFKIKTEMERFYPFNSFSYWKQLWCTQRSMNEFSACYKSIKPYKKSYLLQDKNIRTKLLYETINL